MSELPRGFEIGCWHDSRAATGLTVVIAPPGSAGGAFIAGGGPGTRETDVIGPLTGTQEVSAVLLTGGSAFGLAAADGVVRWLEERGRGHPTPSGPVPIVPAGVIFDLPSGEGDRRPGPEEGYLACEAAEPRPPERGAVGAGAGATVAKALGRERARPGGLGFAARATGSGATVAAVAVVNAFGDVLDEHGGLLACPEGVERSSVELLAGLDAAAVEGELRGNSTLACLMTDATLGKAECAALARAGAAGLARSVSPVFTSVDGDAVFAMASRTEVEPGRVGEIQLAAVAAEVVAAAVRDGVRSAMPG